VLVKVPRLSATQSSVCWRCVYPGIRSSDVDDALERGLDLADSAEQPETYVRCDLVVAGAASVQLAAERADQL
jgi:hypothetical protein